MTKNLPVKTATELPVKLQGHVKILAFNIPFSFELFNILEDYVLPFSEMFCDTAVTSAMRFAPSINFTDASPTPN